MKRAALMIFLIVLSVANLVFAADWHEPDQGAVLEHVVPEADLSPDDSTPHAEHSHAHPPGGSCSHAHSCHAHAHLFSIALSDHLASLNRSHRWQALALPMPPQHFMAPDVPPPIV